MLKAIETYLGSRHRADAGFTLSETDGEHSSSQLVVSQFEPAVAGEFLIWSKRLRLLLCPLAGRQIDWHRHPGDAG